MTGGPALYGTHSKAHHSGFCSQRSSWASSGIARRWMWSDQCLRATASDTFPKLATSRKLCILYRPRLFAGFEPMPTYQYRCEKCGKKFERTETIAEHESDLPQVREQEGVLCAGQCLR